MSHWWMRKEQKLCPLCPCGTGLLCSLRHIGLNDWRSVTPPFFGTWGKLKELITSLHFEPAISIIVIISKLCGLLRREASTVERRKGRGELNSESLTGWEGALFLLASRSDSLEAKQYGNSFLHLGRWAIFAHIRRSRG